MKRTTKFFAFLVVVLCFKFGLSQELVEISGKVIATDEVEGMHVLNETSSRFTVTDESGNFIIPAKLQDTIVFSSIKYQIKRVVISDIILDAQQVTVELEELVNQLDPVLVGKILTGDLDSDLENVEYKPEINFYDLGIPGYTGRRKTLEERRLYAATSGGGLIPLMPLINAITGRTKKLKEQLRLARNDQQMDLAKSKYSKLLFEENTDQVYIIRFFYFVSDDPKFLNISKQANDMDMLDYLVNKKAEYEQILQDISDD